MFLALYLSHVCPIKYDLLFERFLDENRLEAPDIDIDFCKDRRGEVIQYVKEEYGEANVAQIGTFGTLAAKASIKDGACSGNPATPSQSDYRHGSRGVENHHQFGSRQKCRHENGVRLRS